MKKDAQFSFENHDGKIEFVDEVVNRPGSRLGGTRHWSFIADTKSGTIYIKNLNYIDDEYTDAWLRVRNYDGEIIREQCLGHSVYNLRVKPDSSLVAIRSYNRKLYLYSFTDKFQLVYTGNLYGFANMKGDIRCIDFSGDGNALYFTCREKVYKVDTGSGDTKEIPIPELEEWVYGLSVSPDGLNIWVVMFSGLIYTIIKDNTKINEIFITDEGYVTEIHSVRNYFYINYSSVVAIFKNNKYHRLISLNTKKQWGEIRLFNGQFLGYIGDKSVNLYTLDGQPIDTIKFQNPIYDIYWASSSLIVVTTYYTYTFNIVWEKLLEQKSTNIEIPEGLKPIFDQAIRNHDGQLFLEKDVEYDIDCHENIYIVLHEKIEDGIIVEVFPFKGDLYTKIVVKQTLKGELHIIIPQLRFIAQLSEDVLNSSLTDLDIDQIRQDYIRILVIGKALTWIEEITGNLDYDTKEKIDELEDNRYNRFDIVPMKINRDTKTLEMDFIEIETKNLSLYLCKFWNMVEQLEDFDWDEKEDRNSITIDEFDEREMEKILDELGSEDELNDEIAMKVSAISRTIREWSFDVYKIRASEAFSDSKSKSVMLKILGPSYVEIIIDKAEIDELKLRIDIVYDSLFIHTQEKLYCYRKSDGVLLWSYINPPLGYFMLDHQNQSVLLGKPDRTGDNFILQLDYHGNVVIQNPVNTYDMVQKAFSKMAEKEYSNAISLLLKSLEVDFSDTFKAKIYRTIGEAYEAIGDTVLAVKYYEEALDLNHKVGVKKRLLKLKSII